MTSNDSSSDTGYSLISQVDVVVGNVRKVVLDDSVPRIKVLTESDTHIYRPRRAGVVVYGEDEEGLWFSLGIDMTYGDLTDYAGTFEREDKDFVDTALREFSQESLDCFGIFTREDMYDNYMVFNNRQAVIFYYIPDLTSAKRKEFVARFNEAVPHQKDPKRQEIREIRWYKADDLINICRYNRGQIPTAIYSKIRKHISVFLDFRCSRLNGDADPQNEGEV